MGIKDIGDNGQTQPGTARLGIQSHPAPEHDIPLCRRKTITIIIDANPGQT